MSVVVKADQGIRYDSMGDSMRFIITKEDTRGEYTFIEDTIKPGFHAGLHLHRRHSETFYILEGEVTFTVGNLTIPATAGTTIYVPPNVPHAAESQNAGKMLTIFSPGGLEGAMQAFREMSPEALQDGAAVKAVMDKYDIVDLAQPPVPTLISFYDLLLKGDAATLLSIFDGEPHINTPLQGEVRGEAAFEQFVGDQQRWLTEINANPRFFNVIITPERVVVELVIDCTQNGETFDLPVVIAADLQGEKVSAIRVYHTTWSMTGSHIVRAPLLQPPSKKLYEPAVVEAYMEALEKADKEAILHLFGVEGYVREPSGEQYKHTGEARLRHFYDLVMQSGGVMLHHCTATFDGYNFAVEYICDEWGNTKLPPQAGIAVYELDEADKLHGVRIYDDVTPPFED